MKLRRMVTIERGADGQKVKVPSRKWYAVFVAFNGVLRRLPLTENRRAAEALANNIARLNDMRGSNETVLAPALAHAVEDMPAKIRERLAHWDIVRADRAAAAKPLSAHVADWKAALLAKGKTRAHAGLSAYRALRVIDGCKFACVGDVVCSKAQQFIADIRNDRTHENGKVERGIGAACFNSYVRDLRSFFRWMVRDNRALGNPLEDLSGVNAKTDKRHERRALTIDELRWLLEVTTIGPERYGMTGEDRALLYRLAVETGLRSSELRSLTRWSFRLADRPTVTIAAGYAKNGEDDELPLKPATAAMLTKHLAGKMPQAPAFTMPRVDIVIKMLRADLSDARAAWLNSHKTQSEREEAEKSAFLAYRDEAGHVADFHALRHTFISNLAAGGVHPKTAQTLARHSTITLTMDYYTHLRLPDLAGAIDTLPNLGSPARQSVRATGTDAAKSLPPGLPLNRANERNLAQPSAFNSLDVGNVKSFDKTEEKQPFTGEFEQVRVAGIEPARPFGQRILSP